MGTGGVRLLETVTAFLWVIITNKKGTAIDKLTEPAIVTSQLHKF